MENVSPAIEADGGGHLRNWEWYFLNAESRQHAATLQDHHAAMTAVAFSPDGQLLATGGHDGAVRIWNTNTYLNPANLRDSAAAVSSLSWSTDGKQLAVGSRDGAVIVWDVTQRTILHRVLLDGATCIVIAIPAP